MFIFCEQSSLGSVCSSVSGGYWTRTVCNKSEKENKKKCKQKSIQFQTCFLNSELKNEMFFKVKNG